MNLIMLVFVTSLSLFASAAMADSLSIDLKPLGTNPTSPKMGDHLAYHTVVHNNGLTTIDSLIVWISLVQVDKGKEQPVDLEDWSAHKAVVKTSLKSSASIETDWPIRLIRAGHYRVVVSAATRTGKTLATSPFADFSVLQKPVVESQRILPIAAGIPFLLVLTMIGVWRKAGRAVAKNI